MTRDGSKVEEVLARESIQKLLEVSAKVEDFPTLPSGACSSLNSLVLQAVP